MFYKKVRTWKVVMFGIVVELRQIDIGFYYQTLFNILQLILLKKVRMISNNPTFNNRVFWFKKQ